MRDTREATRVAGKPVDAAGRPKSVCGPQETLLSIECVGGVLTEMMTPSGGTASTGAHDSGVVSGGRLCRA